MSDTKTPTAGKALSLLLAGAIGILAGLLLAYVGFLAATATMPLLEGGWR